MPRPGRDGRYHHGDLRAALIDTAVGHARSLTGLHHLKLGVNADNLPARLLYVSRGFRCVGVHPHSLFVDGRYFDEELYILPLSRQTQASAQEPLDPAASPA